MTSINTNIGALVAQKNMDQNSKSMDQALERISSGLRINSAADDAAGSAIASKMESQVRSLGVAIRNANDAISLTQTAEGALGEVENILQRIRELTVQAGNSTLNDSDRSQIQAEVNALSSEIDAISRRTNFNGVNLLDGSRASVNMQIGINAADTMQISLQKTDVSALGIGSSSVASQGSVISSRITQFGALATDDIAATDIKINGKNWTASDFDISATTIDGTATNVSGAIAAGSRQAAALAVKINENTGEHGVTASAFNEVVATMYSAGDVDINGTTVTSRATKELFVAAVNDEVANVSASINANGFVVFSNSDGDAIQFANAAAELGIADDVYAGFVKLTSNNGNPIIIEAGSKTNGYSGDTGAVADVSDIGFNEMRLNDAGLGVKVTGSRAVDGSAISSSTDQLKINGVLIGDSASASAADKATAINAKTGEHGVVATAETSVMVTLDFGATMSDHAGSLINGVTVDFTNATDTATAVTAINTATAGVIDVVASADETTGKLVLTSASGLTISFKDTAGAAAGTNAGAFLIGATNVDGSALTEALDSAIVGQLSNRGIISLTSQDGSSISIEDGPMDRDGESGADKIGFEKMNELATSTTGLSVNSVSAANTSLTSIDAAIEVISSFRAGFGAHENRLDASINNLSTLQVHTDASRSRIEDADFAAETSNLTKSQILSQAATSMLAQANASKQNLLALLQG